MKNENCNITIEVAKSPQEVFNCIADVTKWWSKDYEGNSSKLDDEFTIHHPDQHYSKQRLIEVIPGKKIVWLVTESTLYWLQKDKHDWTNTKMIFDISTAGDKTMLNFTHDGLTPQKESYAICHTGWAIIIQKWLLHFITTSTASPEMAMAAEIRDKIFADDKRSE